MTNSRIPRKIEGQKVVGALRQMIDLAIGQGVWDAGDWRTSFELLDRRVAAADRLVRTYKEVQECAIGEIVSEQLAKVTRGDR